MKYPRLSATLAVVLIALCVLAALSHFGLLAAVAVLALLWLGRPGRAKVCAFDNVIPAELTLARVIDTVLEAFVAELLPFKALSLGVTNGETLNTLKTKKVRVPYLPIDSSAVRNFDAAGGDCYVVDGYEAEFREVTINRRKYVGWGLTSEQSATEPFVNAINYAKLKGRTLAQQVLADVFSVVTAANYPNESVVGAASGFDTDLMFDIRQDANSFKIPKSGRSVILKDDYETALLKDNKDAAAYGNSEPRWNAQLPRIAGMDVYGTVEGLDATSDVDAGIVAFPSGILVAQAPLEPLPAVKEKLVDFQVYTDPDSGISLVYKHMADEWCDKEGEILEATYGYAVGEDQAIMRLVES